MLLASCATQSPNPPPRTLSQLYAEAHDRHFAGIDPWLKVFGEMNKCLALGITDTSAVNPCLERLPPNDTFLPKDRKPDETLDQFMERKSDEWEDIECKYQGFMQARYMGENQRIEAQCLQLLEIKRLRKQMQKLNNQQK